MGEVQLAQMLVGRYALDVPLGSGAMGEVWRGRDLATRRMVAVKLVQLATIDDQAQVAVTIARFRREADTLARLRHPNIISAQAAGRVGNELFMVMELAEGTSLGDLLHQRHASRLGMLPVESVLHIARQTSSGLAAAHAIGVVHRDIKPSNLMVSPWGHLKIVDFGIARLLEDNSPRLTSPSETVGTLLYMSPEQAAGVDVDPRSDLYSFGCVLYELLAGRPPFDAEIPITLMYKHVRERPVPMRNVRPDLPDGLPELVDQLLEKDPGARPAGAEDVERILAAIGGNFDGAVTENLADRRTLLDSTDVTGLPAGPGAETYRATALDDTTRPRQRRGPAAPNHESYRPTVADSAGSGWSGGSGESGWGGEGGWSGGGGEGSWGGGGGEGRWGGESGENGWSGRGGAGENGWSGRGGGGENAWSGGRDGRGGRGGRRGSSDRGNRRADGGPDAWPTVRPRPRSRRLAGVLSSVLTFAVVAGIGAYVWTKTHQALKVTAATVSVVHPGKIGCNATVDVVGMIDTNGKGGPVTYQWTKDGENLPVGTVTATSGVQEVRVDLKWNLRGAGTHHAVAIFQVFTPNVISAQSASFTYKCAR